MKRVFHYTASSATTSLALLIMRIGFGGLMIPHGYNKWIHFADVKEKFISFLGLSTSISLGLNIFAEFFCSILLVLGLFTRLATIPLIITMAVALFVAHQGDINGQGQPATLYLIAYVVLLLTGAGKYSVDAAVSK